MVAEGFRIHATSQTELMAIKKMIEKLKSNKLGNFQPQEYFEVNGDIVLKHERQNENYIETRCYKTSVNPKHTNFSGMGKFGGCVDGKEVVVIEEAAVVSILNKSQTEKEQESSKIIDLVDTPPDLITAGYRYTANKIIIHLPAKQMDQQELF